MTMMKSIRLAFVAAMSVFALVCCKKEALEVSLEIQESVYELNVGETLDLSKDVKVLNTSEKPLFKSSDSRIATVSEDGLVEGVSAGQTKVTVSVADKKAMATIIVKDIVADRITLDSPEELQVGEGLWATVTAEVSPASFNLENLVWTFESDPLLEAVYEKVSVSEYKVHFGAYLEDAGMQVTVKDKNSSTTATVFITALEPEPEEVEAKRISLEYPTTITEGEDAWGSVVATVSPEDYDMENLQWDFVFTPENLGSVETDVVKVSAGEYQIRFLTYVEGGKVDITVTDTVSGKEQYASIAVEEKPAQGAQTLTLSPESLQVYTGADPVSMTVTTTPVEYDRALLNWSSSDENVVTVSNGVITIVGEGTATVKVVDSISGLEAESQVTVNVPVTEATVKSIVLSQTVLSIKYGSAAVQLTATCYDGINGNGNVIENYSELEWSAAKAAAEIGVIEVVTVSQSGVVTPKNIGSTTITVVDKNNPLIKASCQVSVTGVLPNGITLSPATLVLPAGMEYDGFVAVVSPDDSDYKSVTWTSSNPEVATVDGEGKVTTLTEGTTIISAATYNGQYTDECDLTVTNSTFAIALEMGSDVSGGLPQGQTVDISATYVSASGEAYTPTSTSWKSSNESLVTVDENGKVTALADETIDESGVDVVITHTADGEEASVTIKITKALPESISISSVPENQKMYVGETFDFNATVNPGAADQTVKWQCYCSSDEKSFTYIDLASGVFTPQTIGYYSIEVFSAYEYRDANNKLHMFNHIRNSIGIEVMPVPIQTANLNRTSLDMLVGNTASLSVEVTPADATFRNFTWTSSDEEVVKVSSTGIVTAVAAGTATITARQEENDLTLTCTVTVTAASRECNIGDYYYSDGTISSEIIEGKTVIGVVCSLNDVTGHDDKLLADHPNCANGLVISISEAEPVKWQGYGASISNWAVGNGFGTLVGAKSIAGSATESGSALTSEGEKMRGYNNTKAIKAYMSRDDYESLGEDYAVHLLEGWSVEDPSGTSGWFVPSVAEMIAVSENYALLSQKIAAIDGVGFDTAGYWTSTENDGVGSWAVSITLTDGVFQANKGKSTALKVRYVFAF